MKNNNKDQKKIQKCQDELSKLDAIIGKLETEYHDLEVKWRKAKKDELSALQNRDRCASENNLKEALKWGEKYEYASQLISILDSALTKTRKKHAKVLKQYQKICDKISEYDNPGQMGE